MANGAEVVMDQEIREAFQTVNTKLDRLPCSERGEQLARIEQRQENHDSQKKIRLELWKVWVSVAALILVVAELLDKFNVIGN